MCETGISPRVTLRFRYAIARKLERLGQPSRFGFGKPILEYFLPRAITSLTSLPDADCLDSIINIRLMQRAIHSFDCGFRREF
jgi:hypothetical protein